MTCKHKWKYAQQVWFGVGKDASISVISRVCRKCFDTQIGTVRRWERATKLNTRRGMVRSVLRELVPAREQT